MNKYTVTVIIKRTYLGMHQWADAPAHLSFLANPHVHRIYIEVGFPVESKNRELEFFEQGARLDAFLNANYPCDIISGYDFGNRSCEMIAYEIAEFFGARFVRVAEDGEDGALITMESD